MAQLIDLRKKEEKKEPVPATPAPAVTPAPEPKPEKTAAIQPTTAHSPTVRWTAVTDRPASRWPAWYTAAALGAAAVLVVFFWHDILFTIVLVLAAVVVVLRAHAEPKPQTVRIGPSGVMIDNDQYQYHEIKSFWLNYQPPDIKELSFDFKKRYQPRIIVSLADANPLEIRKIMVQYIPETEHEQSFIDQISKKLGL